MVDEIEKAAIEAGYQPRKRPKCDQCGADRLMWLMVKGKYRLCSIEDGAVHVCGSTHVDEFDSFDVETKA